jgi:hypothetical protein
MIIDLNNNMCVLCRHDECCHKSIYDKFTGKIYVVLSQNNKFIEYSLKYKIYRFLTFLKQNYNGQFSNQDVKDFFSSNLFLSKYSGALRKNKNKKISKKRMFVKFFSTTEFLSNFR